MFVIIVIIAGHYVVATLLFTWSIVVTRRIQQLEIELIKFWIYGKEKRVRATLVCIIKYT
jgi:hypothetical protein